MGAINLLERVKGKTAEERIAEKRKMVNQQANEDMAKLEREELVEKVFDILFIAFFFKASSSQTNYDETDDIMRTSAGLGEFRQSQETLTPGELQLGKNKKGEVDDFE